MHNNEQQNQNKQMQNFDQITVLNVTLDDKNIANELYLLIFTYVLQNLHLYTRKF